MTRQTPAHLERGDLTGAGRSDYSVGEVAAIARVSVRTLHHYDAIGLLAPAERRDNGYRRYTANDLERLHKILTYRELGFDLEAIRTLLDTLDRSDADAELEHLRRQRALLDLRIRRLQAMRHTLDTMTEARTMGIKLDPKEMLEVFGEFDPTEHAAEAEERWGDTDAFRQSRERTGSYTKDDWKRIQAEAAEVENALLAAMAAGAAPTDARAMDAAEAHRAHIARWFYDCGYDVHTGLADMYTADPRFKAHYDDRADGFAEYVAAAIHANAARH